MRSSLVLVGFMLLGAGKAAAQEVLGQGPRVERGTRVRILDGAKHRRLEGVLVEWRGDSALTRIDATGAYLVIPPELVERIEVYDGQGSRAGKGARVGALIGFGLGAFAVLLAESDDLTAPSTGEAAATVVLSTATYAGIGALIGKLVKVPRWRPVSTDVHLRVAADPRGRAGLTISIGF